MSTIDIGLVITAINNSAGALNQINQGVEKIGTTSQATANRLKAIQVVIAGIAVQKVTQLTKAFLDQASSMQLLDVKMAAFAGGIPAATALQAKLNAEFNATPFAIDNITASWIKLKSVGAGGSDPTKLLEAVVNAVAALPDASDAKISDLTQSLETMAATGTVSLKQIKAVAGSAGISLGDLAKAGGQSSAEFERSLHNGFLNSSTFIDDFIKASNAKFGDFAVKLGSTLGGAMNKIKNDLNGAMSDLGANTDLNDRLTVAFQGLDKAIMSVISNISQGTIDQFFDLLANTAPILGDLVTKFLQFAGIMINLTSTIAGLLDLLPAGVTTYGILGYLLFGATGFAIGAAIGLVDSVIKRLTGSDILGILQSVTGAGSAAVGGTAGNIFSKQAAMIDANKKNLSDLAKSGPSLTPTGNDNTKLEDMLERARVLANDLTEAFRHSNDQLTQMNLQTSGDELGGKINALTTQTDNWKTAIQNAIDKAQEFEQKNGDSSLNGQIAQLKAMIEPGGPIDQGYSAAVDKLKQITALTNQQLDFEQAITRAQLDRQILATQRGANGSIQFNALSGTSGGGLALDVEQKRYALLDQIDQATLKIKENNIQILENAKNGDLVAALSETNDKYTEIQKSAAAALQTLSAQGEASKQLWKDIGGTIENDVSSGIIGLIGHTQTLGQVAMKVWSDITASVLQYIIKLETAKAMESIMGSTSGGTSSGGGGIGSFFASFLGGSANGNAFNGHITPFANGGVVNGPTLFGLAGEAGTEGILPLTRIGGKLGVHAQGGGANHYHITVNAVDTQSGMEFISKHIDTIDANLSHRRTLNRAGRGG